MKHRWYSDHSVQTAIWAIGRDREIKYQIKKEDDEIIGMRRRRFWGSDAVRLELQGVGADHRPIGVMVSTNRIDWSLLPPILLPPNLRNTGQSGYAKDEMASYKTTWAALLNPVACGQAGIDFYALWWGKDLVWDFDSPNDLKAAFDAADKVAKGLEDEYDVTPVVNFSGSKGFHVWVKAEEAQRIVGWDMKFDGPNYDDPLREQGKVYAKFVKDFAKSLGLHLPRDDLAPNYRQGMVRCPYSIHEKTGQIVFPLSSQQREILRNQKVLDNAEAVAQLLHPWDTESFIFTDGKSWMPPCSSVHSRHLWRV